MLTFSDNDFTTLEEHRYTLRDITDALGYDWGMQDYPIFDEAYREKLNRAIWNHFAYRRIASDTPAMFIFYLNRRMNEQMPNCNKVYELVRREQFNPFATTQGWNDSESEGSSTGVGVATASRTPQVLLNNPDGEQYLTGLSKQTNDGSQKGTSKAHHETISGSVGNAVYDMMASSFVATDNLVFAALEPLFMQTWDDLPM